MSAVSGTGQNVDASLLRARKGLRLFGSAAMLATPLFLAAAVAFDILVPRNNPLLVAVSVWNYLFYGFAAIALIGYSIGFSSFVREACPDPTGHFIGNIALLAIPMAIVMYSAGTFLPAYAVSSNFLALYPTTPVFVEAYFISLGVIIAQTSFIGASMIMGSTVLGAGYQMILRQTFAGRRLGIAAVFMGAFVFTLEVIQLATISFTALLPLGLYGLLGLSLWNFPAGVLLYRKQ